MTVFDSVAHAETVSIETWWTVYCIDRSNTVYFYTTRLRHCVYAHASSRVHHNRAGFALGFRESPVGTSLRAREQHAQTEVASVSAGVRRRAAALEPSDCVDICTWWEPVFGQIGAIRLQAIVELQIFLERYYTGLAADGPTEPQAQRMERLLMRLTRLQDEDLAGLVNVGRRVHRVISATAASKFLVDTRD